MRDGLVRTVPKLERSYAPAASARGQVLGRIGSLEVRLAQEPAEVVLAQKLRFRVFCEEMGACQDRIAEMDRRDADRFDDICDHLLVVDMEAGGEVVGTYRLLRQSSAADAGGFYSSDEFDLDSLVARHPDLEFLELGRSCVLPRYRSKRTIELLWQGIWAYVRRHRIGVMTGCASFAGTIPAAHAEALSFLAHHRRATPEWDVRAVASRYREIDLMPPEAVDARAALAAMPPLIKGYLRLGAVIGDGCVVDHDFATTDVFIILPVSFISERYINHYGSGAQRFAV
jgi:L-ornithine Nalpha-acyltransferase